MALITVADVRTHSGFDINTFSDAVVAAEILRAEREFLSRVALRRILATLDGVRDGVNLVFTVKPPGHVLPASWIGLADLADFVSVIIRDVDGLDTAVTITARSSLNDSYTIDTAPAATDRIYVTGYHCHVRDADVNLATEAIKSLATHYLDVRAQEPGQQSLAPFPAQQYASSGRAIDHLHEYWRLVRIFLKSQDAGDSDASAFGNVKASRTETRIGKRTGIL